MRLGRMWEERDEQNLPSKQFEHVSKSTKESQISVSEQRQGGERQQRELKHGQQGKDSRGMVSKGWEVVLWGGDLGIRVSSRDKLECF